jgi:4-carboxymuconolactone decarboxylase
MAENLKEKGTKTRAMLWGEDPQVVGAKRRLEAFHPDLSNFLDEQLFGNIWTRPGLPTKIRSFITVSALMAMGRVPQLKQHMRGALNLGITVDELKELILHLSQYSGVPTAMEAVRCLMELVAEDEQKK